MLNLAPPRTHTHTPSDITHIHAIWDQISPAATPEHQFQHSIYMFLHRKRHRHHSRVHTARLSLSLFPLPHLHSTLPSLPASLTHSPTPPRAAEPGSTHRRRVPKCASHHHLLGNAGRSRPGQAGNSPPLRSSSSHGGTVPCARASSSGLRDLILPKHA